MGLDTRKPPLPAPTDVSWTDNGSVVAPTDLATDISRRTDRTSYSIPDDGSPLTISTHKLHGETSVAGASQPSLLIEYFEDRGKPGMKPSTRPKIRVRVTPGTKKNDAVKITELGADLKPSYTRRISLGGRGESKVIDPTDPVHSSESNLSSRAPPIEVEVLNNSSDLSSRTGSRTRFIPLTSDISSMPPDSLLEEEPNRQRSRSLERNQEGQNDSLKAPLRRRSRSLSRERIAQRVVEKLKNREETSDTSSRRKSRKSRDRAHEDYSGSRERRRSSLKDDDLRSGTESSLLRPKDQYSNISGTTKSSTTNPRLLQTVEDAIRRLILPEIETIKRQQSLHNDSRYVRRNRDSLISDLTDSSGNSMNKAQNPRVVVTRDVEEPQTLTGDAARRYKREAGSEKSRRDSSSTTSRDAERERKSKLRQDRGIREAAAASTAAAGLTAAALKSHNSQSSIEKEKRERRKQRSKSTSRTESSVTNTEDDFYNGKEPVPPMPMRSEMQDSDLTRDSILSADTSGSTNLPVIKDVRSPGRENSRSSPRTPAEKLRSTRSPSVASTHSSRSAVSAAGLGGAAGALYGLDRKKSSERRSLDPISPNRELDRDMTPRPKGRDTAFVKGDVVESTGRPNTALPVLQKEQVLRPSVEEPVWIPPPKVFPSVREIEQSRQYALGNEHAVNVEEDNSDAFYQDQHELNDKYRSELSYGSQSPDKLHVDLSERTDPFSGGSVVEPEMQHQTNQSGLKPEVMHMPGGPESVVASIFGASTVASMDRRSRSMHTGTYSDVTNEESPTRPPVQHDLFEHDNASMERWAAIKNHVRSLSDESGKGQKTSSMDGAVMSSDGSGRALPEAAAPQGRTASAKSPASDGTQSSVIRKPLGGEQQARENWSQREPQMETSFYAQSPDQHYQQNQSKRAQVQPKSPNYGARAGNFVEHKAPGTSTSRGFSPGRDEGYVSGPPAMSAGSITPLSFSKEPPRLFGSGEPDGYDPIVADDTFAGHGNGRMRQLSNDSREYTSPARASMPSKGASDVQSRDIVALMDLLTGRDGQHSARDTEILVTLVRNASELTNAKDEIIRTIEQQNKINMEKTDMNTDKTLKTLGGPRPQPFTPRDRLYSGEQEGSSGKKPNFFKRALKGLSSKNPSDLDRIEDMFMQILDEMEELREHAGMNRLPSGQQQQQQQHGLNSYERLRAAPYGEEEGLASNQQARNLSSPSGSGGRNFARSHDNDEEHHDHENTERMRTPTQERYDGGVRFSEEDEEIGAQGKNNDKDRKHKSIGSSLFGVFPKISRWSKTTTSSAPAEEYHNDRPYSQHSHSGSQLDLPHEDDVYENHEDDRLRSANSLNRDVHRTPSPRVPQRVKYQAQQTQPMLLHPQPRQGPTDRHHNQLESQADVYDGLAPLPSPDSDAFGSVPNLARFPNGGIAGARSNAVAQGGSPQPRPQQDQRPSQPTESSKAHAVLGIHNPSNAPYQNQPQHTLHRPTASQSSTASSTTSHTSTSSSATSPGQREQPQQRQHQQQQHPTSSLPPHAQAWTDPIPLARKRSPYSPGGLLAPIEERYSMEQSEHGEWAQKHLPQLQMQRRITEEVEPEEPGDRRPSFAESSVLSGRSGRSSGLRNEVLRDDHHDGGSDAGSGSERSRTPQQPRADMSPRMSAVRNGGGGGLATPESQSPLRKITGPRDMPRSASGGSSSHGSGGGDRGNNIVQAIFQEQEDQPRVLMGTRRRKPVPGGRR